MAGLYYEELEVGAVIQHRLGRTLTETDNVLFSSLTMNTQPLHLDEAFAANTQFGKRIVNGIFTLGVVVGITVNELTAGTIVANLGYSDIRHPHPLFHGDTITVETVILNKRESRSNPDRGVVEMKHIGRNQSGDVCIEVTRAALFLKKPDAT
ncbi:MAG: MaoC family dehydratase [Anaerolineaceae bacterium]|nr:MAG: MaoC family dehydratase [Anaerolineaceae bacterium]